MWTASFWKQTLERLVKTFAQSLLAVLGAGQAGILQVDWGDAFNVAALAAAVSLLMSLVSALGNNGLGGATPSAVSLTPSDAPPSRLG
jgi:hypothetical protein